MKKRIKKISYISIVMILLLSMITFYVGAMYSKTANLKTSQDMAVGSGIGILEFDVAGSGDSVDYIWPASDDSAYGWCIDKGANIFYQSATIDRTESAYGNNNALGGNANKIDWLLDNMYRTGSNVPDDEKAYYKNNLQAIVNNHGGGDISGYSDKEMFGYEQFVIWSLTNNVNEPDYPTGNVLYSALKAEADNHANYTHTTTSVSVSKDGVEFKNGVVGPFVVNVSGNANLTSNLGTLYKNEGCTEEFSNGEDYSGNIYLKAESTTSVNATISWDYYNTSATRYVTSGSARAGNRDQDFVVIRREHNADSVSFQEEQGIDGSFTLNLVKYEEGTTKKLPGATFSVKIVDNNGNSVLDDSQTTNGSGEINFSGLPITDEGLTYSITVTETTVPVGYIGPDGPITFSATTELDSGTDSYVLHPDGIIQVTNAKSVNIDKGSIKIEAQNKLIKSGSFDIIINKLEQGTEKGLDGAEFSIEIKKVGSSEVFYTNKDTTKDGGKLTFSGISIGDAGETYEITLREETPPAGYIGIDRPITFKVITKLVGEKDFKLDRLDLPDGVTKVENAKEVKVNDNEILIKVENRTTSIDIHKGVKTVENQDSGYYAVAEKMKELEEKQKKEDEETEKKYRDEKTSEEYTEIELEDIYHDWVVETTIPESVDKYKRYVVTDPVDTTKLDFSGTDRVKVELIGSDGKVKETLKLDDDYKVEYDESTSTLKVTYIDEKDDTFHGTFLSSENVEKNSDLVGSRIRITFNTTFKVNPETGKLVVLEGAITNAENQATLKYDNGNGEDLEKKSEIPEVHTGAVSVFKYEDTNGNGKHDEGEKALEGAEFKIALSEEDAKNGKFIKIDGKELTAVSNKDGIATFIGLSFGGDAMDSNELTSDEFTGAPVYEYDWENASKDYYIVETKSPAGYEKLNDAIKVTISKHSSEIIDLTDKINEMESVANRPLKFDLALRKWVTHAIVTENGKTVVYETGHHAEDDPEAVVKVDLKKSKLNQVKVQFKYSIRVTNEGEIAGEAREITDYIPAGLKFVQEDNPNWTTTSDERVVKTRLLEGVTLNPGESAEVEILLTWINGENTMGVMTNTAEISEDYNEFGVHDIDSTPNNKVTGEDDIDDAPVMLTVKTGSEVIAYTSLGVSFIAIITLGGVQIKRKIC